MRILQLAFKDVGPFEDARFEFPAPTGPGELVLFEGPNGSGKTTVVETIAMVAFELFGPGHESVGLLDERFRSEQGAAEATIAVHNEILSFDRRRTRGGLAHAPETQEARLTASLRRELEDAAGTPWMAFTFKGHQPTATLETPGPRAISESPLAGALSFGRGSRASEQLGQLLTNLENERTKALIYARERSAGSERVDLEQLAASRREAIRRFEEAFSEVLARRITVEFSIDQQAPRIRFDGEQIPLDLLGEGIRSTFSWLADLLVRLERVSWRDRTRSPLHQDFWLILDEIDESLHPKLQARLLPALRRLFPNARIYATTHSPFVVASVGEGAVFSIRPDRDHRVRGPVAARRLEPGQSLELVSSEVFDAPAEFVDEDTRDKLAQHEQDVRTLEQGASIDWSSFLARRAALMGRNDEVRTALSMQELPVRHAIQRELREREGEPTP